LTDIFRDKGTDFRVEYAMTKPAWYVHGIYGTGVGNNLAYTYNGDIMGHNMGGNADDLFCRISKDVPFLSTPYFTSVKAGLEGDYQMHPLTDTPSGVAKQGLTEIAVDLTWTHADSLTFLLKYEFENYVNFDNVSGDTQRNHIVTLQSNFKF